MTSNLLIMGNRTQNVDTGMVNAGYSRLIALDPVTLEPVNVSWNYEGDAPVSNNSYFIDIHPEKYLTASTPSGDLVTLNRANFNAGTLSLGDVSVLVALKNDMTLSPWGDEYTNGNYTEIPSADNHDFCKIMSGFRCFTALRQDKTLLAWGNSDEGGVLPDNISSRNDITDSHHYTGGIIEANNAPYLVAWGNQTAPVDIIANMENIIDVRINDNDGIILTSEGKVYAWGNNIAGIVPPDILQLNDITNIYMADAACVALRSTGQIVGWGISKYGGLIPDEIAALTDIDRVICGRECFAAIRKNGAVVAWGEASDGGFIPDNILSKTNIVDAIFIKGTNLAPLPEVSAFVALCADGTVCAWGEFLPIINLPEISDAVSLSAGYGCCCALKKDGTVVSWGTNMDQSPVDDLLNNVLAVYSGSYSFIALKNDNTIVVWGDPSEGGDMSKIPADVQNNVSYYL